MDQTNPICCHKDLNPQQNCDSIQLDSMPSQQSTIRLNDTTIQGDLKQNLTILEIKQKYPEKVETINQLLGWLINWRTGNVIPELLPVLVLWHFFCYIFTYYVFMCNSSRFFTFLESLWNIAKFFMNLTISALSLIELR